ncbi:MAG TPA: hypothetical protein VF841_12950, partial [Anaeromyxobacter sp.]
AVAAAPAASTAPAAPRPPPAAIPVEKLDTIHLADGGRMRCVVLEETSEGVVVRRVDGSERRYAPDQVSRIDYADGTRSDLPAAAAPALAPAAAPAPAPPPAR